MEAYGKLLGDCFHLPVRPPTVLPDLTGELSSDTSLESAAPRPHWNMDSRSDALRGKFLQRIVRYF